MLTFVGEMIMRSTTIFFLVSTLAVTTGLNAQTIEDQIGFTRLETELGALLPDGTGLNVAHVEAQRGPGNQAGNYLPSFISSAFTGKTFVDGSAGNGLSTAVSSHATSVGFRFYGTNLGLASGIDNITAYEANDFINRVLGDATGTDPLSNSYDITNHSYIGSNLTNAE